jgi:hypothetical protein
VIVATGDMDYSAAVLRARDVERLNGSDRGRVLDRLEARYPEAVAVVLDELLIPAAYELERLEACG